MQNKTGRDFKVAVLFGLFIVVQFPQRLFAGHCPSSCWCENNSVNCNEKTLTEIPNDLPRDTVYLNMDNNQLRVLDLQVLSKLPELQFLTIRDNQITKVKTAKTKHTNLKTLDLHGNCIRILKSSTFAMTPTLMNFDLSKNSLTNAEGLFKNLSHLVHLTLSDNSLSDFSDDVFVDTVRLQKLVLNDNKLERLDFSVFRHLRQLSLLDLTRNPIGEITGSSQNNTNLNILDLSQCRLAEIPSNLPSSLLYLNVGSNKITIIKKTSLENYRRLENLVLDHNEISTIESRSLLHLENLTDLDLSDNSLTDFPGFFPKSLRYVYLDRNDISTLSFTSFSRIPYLSSLSLKDNRLTKLNRKSFRILRSLKFLYMDGNPLKVLAEDDLSEQRELEVLSLNSCPLEKLAFRPFIKLKKLRELHLAFIKHRVYFDTDVFKELPHLEKLNLQGSPALIYHMISTPENLAHIQESIKVFNIMNGYLTYLPSDLKNYLRSALKIKLAGNPLRCDANLEWLHHWIKEDPDKFPQKDLIICETPGNIQGTPIDYLPEGYFQSLPPSSLNQPVSQVFNPNLNAPDLLPVSQEIILDLDYDDDLKDYPVSGADIDPNCNRANTEEAHVDTDIKTETSKYASAANTIESDISSFPPQKQSTSATSSTPCADCDDVIYTGSNRLDELTEQSSTTRINDARHNEIQDGKRSSESDDAIVSVTAYNNRFTNQPLFKDISSTKISLDESNLPRSDISKEIITNIVTATPFKHVGHNVDVKETTTHHKEGFEWADLLTTEKRTSTLTTGNLNAVDIEIVNENIKEKSTLATGNPNALDIEIVNNNSNDNIKEKTTPHPNIKVDNEIVHNHSNDDIDIEIITNNSNEDIKEKSTHHPNIKVGNEIVHNTNDDIDIEIFTNNSNEDIKEKSTHHFNIKVDREAPYYLKLAAITASSWAGVLTVVTGSFLFLLRRFRQKEKKERGIIRNDPNENC